MQNPGAVHAGSASSASSFATPGACVAPLTTLDNRGAAEPGSELGADVGGCDGALSPFQFAAQAPGRIVKGPPVEEEDWRRLSRAMARTRTSAMPVLGGSRHANCVESPGRSSAIVCQVRPPS
jgi:hypothetical protein